MGEEGNGDGDGVLANGDNGMWPTDLRRLGIEAVELVCKDLTPEPEGHTVVLPEQPVCNLCFKP